MSPSPPNSIAPHRTPGPSASARRLPPKGWPRPLLALWAAQLASGMLLGPIFTLYAIFLKHALGLPASTAAELRAAFVGLGGIMALPGGIVCATLGPRRAYGLSLTCAMAIGVGFLLRLPLPPWGLALLWGSAIYAGMMGGLGSVAGQSYLIAAVPREMLGTATAGYFLAMTLGHALGNLIGGRVADAPLADGGGYAALGAVAIGGGLALVLSAVRWLPEVPSGAPARAGAAHAAYRRLVSRPEIWLLLLLRFFPTTYWGVVTFLQPLLIYAAAGRNQVAGDYTAIALAASAASQWLTGRLCDRGYRRRVMLVAGAGVIASAAGLLAFHTSLVGIYSFGVLGAMLAWVLSTTMPSIVRDLSAPDERPHLLAATHGAWSAGFVSGTLVAGRWSEAAPVALAIALGCAAMAGAAILALLPFLRGERPTA